MGLVKSIERYLRCLKEGHDYKPVRNIHGDEINQVNKRSVEMCTKCERVVYKDELNEKLLG